MSKAVFDSSAILALYHKETGRKKVLQLMNRHDPLISAVNLAEVVAKLMEEGLSTEDAVESFDGLDISVIDFEKEQAIESAELRSSTKHLGLSLGDRACLTLAVRENAIAVTADKNWAALNLCRVDVIR
jgi:ribonuclease VapC